MVMAFLAVLPIHIVIEQIDGTRKSAKHDHRLDTCQEVERVQYRLRKDCRQQDKAVFYPLMRPQGAKQ